MRPSIFALSILILAVPVSAIAQEPPAQATSGMRQFFTPEQRAMYMEQSEGDLASMTRDQRHAQSMAMRAKLDAMSDADKTKLRAEMQAKYDALTPDQKQSLEAKIAERRARRQQSGGQ